MFTDRITLELCAGKGGNGTVAFRREKYRPKAGPSGGDGGDGGSIILVADRHDFSLEAYRNVSSLRATDGQKGGGSCCTGKQGQDLFLKIPVGTLVKDSESGDVLFDITEDGSSFVICQGGIGGKGNDRFKSPTNRAPDTATPGTEGESRLVELELKLIADVGLVGFPNAGKSTFFSLVTSHQVKAAPYPFTTLRPHIGHIENENGDRILFADIPGIIEGAHENRGLGLEFLRHIERTKLLLFLLDASGSDGRDPCHDFEILLHELRSYAPSLLKKPRLIALNKCDCPEAAPHIEQFRLKHTRETPFEISSLTGHGLDPLITFLKRRLRGKAKRKTVPFTV